MQIMNTFTLFFMVFFFYAVPTGLLSILEYFLAKMENPWPGRVLPILSVVNSLCWALILLLNMAAMLHPSLYFLPLAVLVVLNIPTLIFLLIYKSTRKKFTEHRVMNRKDLQDL